MKPIVREILITFLIAVVIFLGLQATIQNYEIHEGCMEPNFYEGQRVLVNKIVYKLHEPERGDVIILKPPEQYNTDGIPFIKRIIALPGENIVVEDGEVYINGIELYEPYIKEAPRYTLDRTLGENEYFVLGDNRNNANDSHEGWTVPREDIIGKAWLTIWPLDKMGLVSNNSKLLVQAIP